LLGCENGFNKREMERLLKYWAHWMEQSRRVTKQDDPLGTKIAGFIDA